MHNVGAYLDLPDWDFPYVRVQQLRDAGIMQDEIDDYALYRALLRAGVLINQVTDQWFAPVCLEPVLDGNDWRRMSLPNYIPFIQVDWMYLESGDISAPYPVPASEYVVKKRWIELRVESGTPLPYDSRVDPLFARQITRSTDLNWTWPGKLFREGVANVSIGGWFGWLQMPTLSRAQALGGGYTAFNTTVTSATSADITTPAGKTVPVSSTTGVKVGMNVVFGSGTSCTDKKFGAIVTGKSANTVTIDFIPEDLAEDDLAHFFPRTPVPIQQAALILLAAPALMVGDPTSGGGAEPPNFTSRLIEERTDNYMYRLQPLGGSSGGGGAGPLSTGVPEADRLLADYVRPAALTFI